MTLASRLVEYVSACFTGIWIQSHEHFDALQEIAQMCRRENWRLALWDIERGLQLPGLANGQSADAGGTDPLAAIRSLNALAAPDSSALLVMVNFHRFLNSPEIVQALAQQIIAGKQNRTFVLVLSPLVQIPPELEKLFIILDHDLPTREQLEGIVRSMATEEGDLPQGEALATVLDAAAGLTRFEAEGAFSLSLVRHQRIEPEAVWELKSGMLKKSGLLTLHRGRERFADLGGLDNLKGFCLKSLRQQGQNDPRRRPKGVLLLSPPGCGKSQFCKALGNEVGRPTLVLDVGSLMGSLVGQTEANVRQALKIADAMSPCLLMADEVEKALSGVAGGGATDSGVSAPLFGTLLTWLNDRTSDVYVVCTCNDIAKLPPEFSRTERFDGVFFVELPGVQQRRAIWNIFVPMYGLDPHQPKPVDADWTGAEIKACCRLAALLEVPLVEAAQNVVPLARTACEAVANLRKWATGRCLSADMPGIYMASPETPREKPRRKLRRDPSNN